MDIQKCAHFYNNPHLAQERVVRKIVKYLASTSTYMDPTHVNRWISTRGVFYKRDKEKGIECYVDVNLAGGWDQADYDNTENFILC